MELPDTSLVKDLSSYHWLPGTENICHISPKEMSNSTVSWENPRCMQFLQRNKSKNNFHILIWHHQEKLYIPLRETTPFMYLRAGPNKTHIMLRPGHSTWLKREDFWGVSQALAILRHPGSTHFLPKNLKEGESPQTHHVPLLLGRLKALPEHDNYVGSLVFFRTVPCCPELLVDHDSVLLIHVPGA